jgi:2-polyprenyl-3-methyl-5-hydroxy-6-metoxy-1,4-benzoquinol methylase
MIKKILGLLKHKKINEIHEYWRKPNDINNDESGYLDSEETLQRSEFLLGIVNKYFTKEAKILELGCNVGRNLNHLYKNGYHKLAGIEINESAVKLMHKHYQEMADNSDIKLGEIEKYIREMKDQEYDLVFSMAVLEHIHSDSDWIFDVLPKKTKYILIIEDEKSLSWRHFPRRYDKVFKKLNMVHVEKCEHIRGFNDGFYLRLFQCNQ